MRLCKALNMHCTELMALEGLLYCRGKQMENSEPEEFDFDRMVYFLNMKSKMVAPADNPRIALTTKMLDNHIGYPTQRPGSLPALQTTAARTH